jgi:hypothetical protein
MPNPGRKLLLEVLLAESFEDDGSRAASRIINTLLQAPVTDAERVGERLLVFGWERDRIGSTTRWRYRVVGETTGDTYVGFTLALGHDDDDILLSVYGLQLQIALNGMERSTEDELDCYLELVTASRRTLARS